MKKLSLLLVLLLVLSGCNSSTGIQGDNNDDNQVINGDGNSTSDESPEQEGQT